MQIFLQALVLILVMEGVCFALFPGKVRLAMLELVARGEGALRSLGIAALILALVLLFLLRLL